jgi:hypothetical protein
MFVSQWEVEGGYLIVGYGGDAVEPVVDLARTGPILSDYKGHKVRIILFSVP